MYLTLPMKVFPLELGISAKHHKSFYDGATRWSKSFKIGLVI